MKARRHDLDWLRVMAFGLLVVYHLGLGFIPRCPWPYGNSETSEGLGLLLTFLSQWRLPVLFLISGMGTRFALSHRTGGRYITERLRRLLIPLLFGVNFIVLIQACFVARHQGEVDPTGAFLLEWWLRPLGEKLQHLWFVWHLLWFSLLGTPLFFYLRDRPDCRLLEMVRGLLRRRGGILLLALPLVLVEWTVKPWRSGPIVGYQIPWHGLLFLLGYILVCVREEWEAALDRIRNVSWPLGLALSGLLLWVVANSSDRGRLLLNGNWANLHGMVHDHETLGFCLLHSLNTWTCCVAVFALGARYLNRPSRGLPYWNQGVYPFYIVHQPIILGCLLVMKDWSLGIPVKLLLITAVTLGGCWLVFELARRTALTRVLFGIKPLPTPPRPAS